MEEKNKKLTNKEFFDLSEVFGYFFRKKGAHPAGTSR